MSVKLRAVLITFIALICFSAAAGAVSIGVSPSRLTFDNVLPGGYNEQLVTISTNSDRPLTGYFEVKGDMSEWLRFSPNSTRFEFSSKVPYVLHIIVEPPADARQDSYSADVQFVSEGYADMTGRAGGLVHAAVNLKLISRLTNEEETKCRAGGFYIEDIEEGLPLRFGGNVVNDGNVRIMPTLSIDVWDQSRETLLISKEVPTENEIFPTLQGRVSATLGNGLPIGQYWATIGVDECQASQFLTFSVYEKGGIVDKGNFKDLRAQLWNIIGDPILITATFQNAGKRTVFAEFQGKIMRDNTLIGPLESSELQVSPGETLDFEMIFDPDDSGRYVVSGYFKYNNKITFEKSTIVNVNYPDEGEKRLSPKGGTVLLLLAYLAIIVTIIFLLRRILRKRRSRS